jgi:flagellar basal body rod protein FlgB
MLSGILDRAMQVSPLKQTLDLSVQRTKAIAGRVAQASVLGDGFAMPGAAATSTTESGAPIDLEQEMVSLADEQMHFEATAKLLQKAYEQLRTAIKDK